MVFAGYASAVGLFYAAGMLAARGINQNLYISPLEKALKNDLPDADGKTSYVVLECMGTPSSFSLLPQGSSALVGRVHIQKQKSHIDLGVGSSMDGKSGGVFTATPRKESSAIQMSFVEPAVLNSSSGPVVLHQLDFAKWDGASKKEDSYTPQQAAIPLRALNLQPDLLADHYQITIDSFENDHLFVFGEATKRGKEIHMNLPSNDFPFLVIKEDPQTFVTRKKLEAQKASRDATTCAFSSAALGTGTRCFQLIEESRWHSQFHQFRLEKMMSGTASHEFSAAPKKLRIIMYGAACVIASLSALNGVRSTRSGKSG